MTEEHPRITSSGSAPLHWVIWASVWAATEPANDWQKSTPARERPRLNETPAVQYAIVIQNQRRGKHDDQKTGPEQRGELWAMRGIPRRLGIPGPSKFVMLQVFRRATAHHRRPT